MAYASIEMIPPATASAVRAEGAPRSVARSSRNTVRPLEEGDLEGVARLFLSRLREKRGSSNERATAEVANYMRQLYFEGPGCEAGAASLVQISGRGEIGAFIGIIRTTYLLDGKPLAAGMKSAFMAAPEGENAFAAIELLRELHRCPLDLIFTDSANRSSLRLCRALKHKIMSPESLEWAFAFEPAALIFHKVRQRWPMAAPRILQPLAGAADFAAKRALRKHLKRGALTGWSDVAIDASTFVELAPRFLEHFRLRPEWSFREFGWLTTQAGQRRSVGPLHFHLVRDPSDNPVGCYAFYGAKGGVARVLHATATNKGWEGMIGHILDTAESMGCIGVHGSMNKGMMPHVYAIRGMFFYHAAATTAYSNRADVLSAVENGEAFVGGFAGDRWTRLGNDEFGRSDA
jgi:hypothetical protein